MIHVNHRSAIFVFQFERSIHHHESSFEKLSVAKHIQNDGRIAAIPTYPNAPTNT